MWGQEEAQLWRVRFILRCEMCGVAVKHTHRHCSHFQGAPQPSQMGLCKNPKLSPTS